MPKNMQNGNNRHNNSRFHMKPENGPVINRAYAAINEKRQQESQRAAQQKAQKKRPVPNAAVCKPRHNPFSHK